MFIQTLDEDATIASTSSITLPKPVVSNTSSIAADYRNYGRDPSSRRRQPTISKSNTSSLSDSMINRKSTRSKGKRIRSTVVEIESSDEVEVGLQFERKRTRSNRSYSNGDAPVDLVRVDEKLSVETKKVESVEGELKLLRDTRKVNNLSMDVGSGSLKGNNTIVSTAECSNSLKAQECEIGSLSINEIFRSRGEFEFGVNFYQTSFADSSVI